LVSHGAYAGFPFDYAYTKIVEGGIFQARTLGTPRVPFHAVLFGLAFNYNGYQRDAPGINQILSGSLLVHRGVFLFSLHAICAG